MRLLSHKCSRSRSVSGLLYVEVLLQVPHFAEHLPIGQLLCLPHVLLHSGMSPAYC
jgi:hypothetical protein